jgi:hypothetical protein
MHIITHKFTGRKKAQEARGKSNILPCGRGVGMRYISHIAFYLLLQPFHISLD